MIEVNFIGRTGNNLFQYSFGRILSELTGLPFVSNEISLFKNIELSNFKNKEEISKKFDNQIILKRHLVDIEEIKKIVKENKNTKIILSGYFQQFKYYEDFSEKIKGWLTFEKDYQEKIIKKFNITNNDVAVHVRLGDYKTLNYVIEPCHIKKIIKIAISNVENPGRLFIITDDKNDSYLDNFKDLNPIVVSSSLKEDFYLLSSFKNIIISQSSFSWWASFFASEDSKIYCPKTFNYGQWGVTNKKQRKEEISLVNPEKISWVEK